MDGTKPLILVELIFTRGNLHISIQFRSKDNKSIYIDTCVILLYKSSLLKCNPLHAFRQ